MSRCAIMIVLLAGLSTAACGAAEPVSEWEGSIDTLASGVVVVSNPERGLWGNTPAWRLEPELTIGSVDVEGPEMFGQAADAAEDAYGRIFVLDRTAKEIRMFDAAGVHVRTFARGGAGPGELENPNGMKLSPDGRLWVSDPRNARYAVFDTSGAFVTHHPRPITSWGWLWEGGFTADGSMYERGVESAGRDESRPVLIRLTTDSAVALADTLPLPETDTEAFEFDFTGPDGRAGTIFMPVPFAPATLTLFDPRGYVWAAETGGYRLTQIELSSGDTVRIIQKPFEPIEVRQEEIDEMFSYVRERITDVKYDASRIPKTKPAIRRLHVDEAGYLWVEPHTAFEADSSAFDVFDDRGVYLGRVTGPLRLKEYATLAISGDGMLGFTQDDLDVTHVVRLRIRGRETAVLQEGLQ